MSASPHQRPQMEIGVFDRWVEVSSAKRLLGLDPTWSDRTPPSENTDTTHARFASRTNFSAKARPLHNCRSIHIGPRLFVLPGTAELSDVFSHGSFYSPLWHNEPNIMPCMPHFVQEVVGSIHWTSSPSNSSIMSGTFVMSGAGSRQTAHRIGMRPRLPEHSLVSPKVVGAEDDAFALSSLPRHISVREAVEGIDHELRNVLSAIKKFSAVILISAVFDTQDPSRSFRAEIGRAFSLFSPAQPLPWRQYRAR